MDDALRDVFTRLTTLGVDLETLAARFAQLAALHATEVRALRVLSDSSAELTVGELGSRLGLTTGATTRMVDRMERAGCVARVRGKVERRAVYVHMTEQAWSMAEAFFGQIGGAVIATLGEEFTAEELAVVTRFLTSAEKAVRAARVSAATTEASGSVPP
jgi:DNA-binding MarR family transcriptional regulator